MWYLNHKFYLVMNILCIKTMSMATTYPNITTRGQVPFTCSLGITILTVNMLEKYLLLYNYEYSLIRTPSPSIGIKGTPNFYARKENKVRVLIINTTIHAPQSCICPFKCQQIILICFFFVFFYLPTRGNAKEIWNLETQCRCRRS